MAFLWKMLYDYCTLLPVVTPLLYHAQLIWFYLISLYLCIKSRFYTTAVFPSNVLASITASIEPLYTILKRCMEALIAAQSWDQPPPTWSPDCSQIMGSRKSTSGKIMPTVQWFIRGCVHRYYFSCFKRFGMSNEVHESYCCAFVHYFVQEEACATHLKWKAAKNDGCDGPYVSDQTDQQRHSKEIRIYSLSTTRSCISLRRIHILGQRIIQRIFQIQKRRVSQLCGCHASHGKIYALLRKRP